MLAHHAAGRPALRLTEVAAELEDQRRRLDLLSGDDPAFSVRAAFSRSYRDLPSDASAAFRLIGRLPGRSVHIAAFAAAAELDVAAATRSLNRLVRQHLVSEPRPGVYMMHDVLRFYAAELADLHGDDGRAVRRLFDHYLASAVRADRLITPNRYQVADAAAADASTGVAHVDAEAARSWMRAELPVLLALFQVDDPALDIYIWQLAYTLRGYFYLARELDAWLQTHQVALRSALRLGDQRAEALTRNNLGMVLTAVRRFDEAVDEHHQAHALFEAIGEFRGMSDCLANIGALLSRQERYEEALLYQQDALRYYLDAGLSRNSGITLRSMANTYLALGQLDEGVRCAEEALSLALAGEHGLDIAQAGNILGTARERTADHVRAEIALRQALVHAESCGSVREQAKAHWVLGEVALATGRRADAESSFNAAVHLYERAGSSLANSVREIIGSLRDA
ncbi:hypothetical protein BBK82_38290 [Lentzea guizhouensis]|uniref:Uncharacterized protein n=1 Tax=Lentzea guizhouensis TaxID=1586287 RepID=A0A1B2HTA9_9PSEU|nr:hypothetical protein BBK82_38290 [Lentzea guizhouensis]